jgi:hypothetical protein
MKHLLTGIALIATLASAAPVWAQTAAPMTPGGNNPTSGSAGPFAPNPPAAAPTPPAANPTGARGGRSVKRYMHHIVHRNRWERGMSAAEQLNSAELQRIQAGAPPPMPSYQR